MSGLRCFYMDPYLRLRLFVHPCPSVLSCPSRPTFLKHLPFLNYVYLFYIVYTFSLVSFNSLIYVCICPVKLNCLIYVYYQN